MTFSRRNVLRFAGLSLAAPALLRSAVAQVWPTRVVHLVVGLAAGGGSDAVARILAGRLSQILGQQVVVENKSGASGNAAFENVAHAPPDGHTVLFSTTSIVTNPLTFASVNYDTFADFSPVTLIGQFPNMLAVGSSSPATSLEAFIAYARANPGKVTFASTGVGSIGHFCGELLKQKTGIEMTHVPYRGVAAGAMSDLLGGRLDSMINATASLLPSVRAGQLRALGVTSAQRFATAPDIPTFAESGVQGFDVTPWYGLFMPAKTPASIVGRLRDAAISVLGEAAVKEKLEQLGVVVGGSTPAELGALMRAEAEMWRPVIAAANIRIQ